jgi:hypothetical protein
MRFDVVLLNPPVEEYARRAPGMLDPATVWYACGAQRRSLTADGFNIGASFAPIVSSRGGVAASYGLAGKCCRRPVWPLRTA